MCGGSFLRDWRLLHNILQQIHDVAGCDTDRLTVWAHGAPRDEVVTELTNTPHPNVDQRLLCDALLHIEVELDGRVRVELCCGSHHVTEIFALAFLDEVPPQAHHLDQGIDLPTSVGRVLLDHHANLRTQLFFEVGVGNQEIIEQFLRHVLNVLLIDQRVSHVQCPFPDRDVVVLEAIDDGGAMPLHGLHINSDNTLQRRKRHVPNVVVPAEQKAAKNVDAEDSQPTFGLDGHDGEDALIKNGIACVLGALGVSRNLREDIVHLVAGIDGVGAQNPEKSKDFALQERIGYSCNVVLCSLCITRGDQIPQCPHQGSNVTPEIRDVVRVDLQQRRQETTTRDQHTVVAVIQELTYLPVELVLNFLHLSDDPHRAQGRLLLNVWIGRRH
mmetsp:Transcript_2491/g.7354  ORF Transcript_2491/g.7354 Transcript_2491/m.7354 type:complete len:386 (-) Transcript_2491:484-1641(-)